MKFFFTTYLTLLCSTLIFSQAGELKAADRIALQAAEADLLALSYTMNMDSVDDARFRACNLLIKGLVKALKTPNSFRYDFPELRGVNILNAPDNSFRFFTWELHVSEDHYRHYGAIQYNTSELKLVPLIDRGDKLKQNPETTTGTNEDWIGYVAYNIIPAGVFNDTPYYFLFGHDHYGEFSSQKILDVFYFDDQGRPRFGLPVFAIYTPEGHLLEDHTRILLQYSAEARVALRHEPETGRIIYENLVLAKGPDDGPISLPDGSYHAIELGKDGRWHEVSKIFSHTYEKAPVERVKVAGDVDILGRPGGGQ